MSVDKAWTYTIGLPSVKIAIIDCGIEWDNADSANKAYLNMGELVEAPMPQNAKAARAGHGRSTATTATVTASSASRTTPPIPASRRS
jgi:hypothetical protein